MTVTGMDTTTGGDGDMKGHEQEPSRLTQWADLIIRCVAAVIVTGSIIISVCWLCFLMAKPIVLSVWPELPAILEEAFSAPSPSPAEPSGTYPEPHR